MTEQHKRNWKFIIITLAILAAALTRLIPHSWNFTPIGGMALFGAAYFSRKYWAFIIPFVALWLSDLVLNNTVYAEFYGGFYWGIHPGTYLGFAAVILLGILLLHRVSVTNVFAASIGGAVLFFLISNFFVWLGSTTLPKNLAGLLTAYTAGIPFFWKTLAGFLLYSGLLFGAYEWAKKRWGFLALEKAEL